VFLACLILSIAGHEVERVDWNQGIVLWAKPTKRSLCLCRGRLAGAMASD